MCGWCCMNCNKGVISCFCLKVCGIIICSVFFVCWWVLCNLFLNLFQLVSNFLVCLQQCLLFLVIFMVWVECCSRCIFSECFSVCRWWLMVGCVVVSWVVVVDRLLVLMMCMKVWISLMWFVRLVVEKLGVGERGLVIWLMYNNFVVGVIIRCELGSG